ncbi:MAG: potassium channel family protein [Candidatus Sericytochromatia bacterium]|nr:potassium channel family protein [Candidatus Sericytochromatia bacterium]
MTEDVMLVGDNPLTKRLRQLLAPAGHCVRVDPAALPEGACTAIVVATDDDGHNLDLALLAMERSPPTRHVIRIDSPALARGLQERLPTAVILCPPAIAASSFAAATVHPTLQGALQVKGELHVLWETRVPPADAQILARDDQGECLVLAPWQEVAEWLAKDGPVPRQVPAGGEAPDWPDWRGIALDPVVVVSVACFLGLLAFGTLFFAYAKSLSWLDALYFTATTVATVGYGDISLHDASVLPKVVGIGMMFAGVTSVSVMTALVTDGMFRYRTAVLKGHRRSRLQGHVVLCGLGRLGVGIIDVLQQMGEQVVAIEPAPDPLLARLIQQHGVQLIQADASHPESLAFANLPQAKVLIAATGEDLVNIRIALTSAAICPSLPMVLRILTPELAHRAQQFLGFGRTLSPARLAAEAFAAAVLKDDRVCLVAEWRGQMIELIETGDGQIRVRDT